MCTTMRCRKSSQDTGCSGIPGIGAAEGTTCGSGKVKINFNIFLFLIYLVKFPNLILKKLKELYSRHLFINHIRTNFNMSVWRLCSSYKYYYGQYGHLSTTSPNSNELSRFFWLREEHSGTRSAGLLQYSMV
jgi:hypothetical protein